MRHLILVTIASVSVCIGARLDHDIYLPASARSAGGAADSGLQAPLAPSAPLAPPAPLQPPQQQQPPQILRYENEFNERGYHYAYETSDGTKAEQDGQVLEDSLKVAGSYSYVGSDGQTYSVTYTADEEGFRAEGAHLPTSPPVPHDILNTLQLTDTKQGQYSSQKSSYDADAGY